MGAVGKMRVSLHVYMASCGSRGWRGFSDMFESTEVQING